MTLNPPEIWNDISRKQMEWYKYEVMKKSDMLSWSHTDGKQVSKNTYVWCINIKLSEMRRSVS